MPRPTAIERRHVLKVLSAAGIGSAVFGRALVAAAADAPKITDAMLMEAEWVAGIKLTDEQRRLALDGLNQTEAGYAKLRAVALANAVAPAFTLDPTHGVPTARPFKASSPARSSGGKHILPPGSKEDVAFAPVTLLSEWLARKTISSTELTKTYLERIEALDPKLHAVITLTPERALKSAAAADTEIANGRRKGTLHGVPYGAKDLLAVAGYPTTWGSVPFKTQRFDESAAVIGKLDAEIASGRRKGPLHGIPYGAKDLLAVAGYPTTWGSVPFKTQRFDESAAVIGKLDAAGAVLVAKTAVGELAWGDVWFDGMCRNPWKLDQGSSGSSAGSASLTAAGCVAFAIGTETWGSIVSPCTRCGTTGLRPTFGRVSRRGAMALSWTMDKIGPIARSAADCALVFAAIEGRDGLDAWSRSAPFAWPLNRKPSEIKLGFVKSLFEADYTEWADKDEDKRGYEDWKSFDAKSLEVLRGLGFQLVPIELSFSVPVGPLGTILTAEAACAFDALVRDGGVNTMVRQTADAWPNVFRQGEMVPAVEYLRAQRLRSIVAAEMAAIMATVDAYVVPSFGGDNLLLTNLTGHPAVVVPNGFRSTDGTPTSITFQGRLDEDDLTLAIAQAYQQATDFHTKRPSL